MSSIPAAGPKPQSRLNRICFYFLVSVTAFFLISFVYMGDQRPSLNQMHLLLFHAPIATKAGYLVSTPGCQMPLIDPFHPSVKRFYHKVDDFRCPGRPSFIKYELNGTLNVDIKILHQQYNVPIVDLKCRYKAIKRDGGNSHRPTDNKFKMSSFKNLTFGDPIQEDAVFINCSDSKRVILEEYLPLTPLKAPVEARCEKATPNLVSTEPPLNIIFLGIDSISKLNFIRHFQKTKKTLEELAFFEMNGYSKVGDNTFPNIYPMLTGKPCKKGNFYDDIGIIWKEYAKVGYRTLLTEDAPNMATFNYQKKGFMKPPTDYFLRPFALATERSTFRRKNHCMGSKLEMQVYYDHFLNFVDTMESRLFFAFVYLARMTHDELNNAGYADKPANDVLQSLHDRGLTNNSLIFFFSDHGIRFGDIRSTYVGKLEENWPFMFISLPRWFLESHPDITNNLRLNRHRLTTPFDVHATVVQYLTTVVGHTMPSVFNSITGVSFFKEVPLNRTCDAAGIESHWCTCEIYETVPQNSPKVLEAAKDLMKQVNGWLEPHQNLCTQLTLLNITDSRMAQVRSDKEVKKKTKDPAVEILISVVVAPSGGRLESTLRKTGSEWKVIGDVSRTDKYGHQGDCVEDAWLGKFCFCLSKLKEIYNRNETKGPT